MMKTESNTYVTGTIEYIIEHKELMDIILTHAKTCYPTVDFSKASFYFDDVDEKAVNAVFRLSISVKSLSEEQLVMLDIVSTTGSVKG